MHIHYVPLTIFFSLLQHKMMLLLLIVFLGMLVAATKLEGPYKEVRLNSFLHE